MSVKLKAGESLMEVYMKRFVKTGNWNDDKHMPSIDTLLRECIGKTDDISVPLCNRHLVF